MTFTEPSWRAPILVAAHTRHRSPLRPARLPRGHVQIPAPRTHLTHPIPRRPFHRDGVPGVDEGINQFCSVRCLSLELGMDQLRKYLPRLTGALATVWIAICPLSILRAQEYLVQIPPEIARKLADKSTFIPVVYARGIFKAPGEDARPKRKYQGFVLSDLEALAKNGDAEAEYELGIRYYNGIGVVVDQTRAFSYWLQGAKAGHLESENETGVCFARGEGVEKDIPQAIAWYSKAADEGSGDAADSMGVRFLYGRGVPQDSEKAFHWFQRGAELGNNEAIHALATCYFRGIGTQKDEGKAMDVLIGGANKGDRQLMLTLGCAYLNGWTIPDGSISPKDDRKAFGWMTKAAQAGSTHAMFVLGGLYFEGRGTSKNIKTGISWFERSAKLGNELSQAVLEKIDPDVLNQYGY